MKLSKNVAGGPSRQEAAAAARITAPASAPNFRAAPVAHARANPGHTDETSQAAANRGSRSWHQVGWREQSPCWGAAPQSPAAWQPPLSDPAASRPKVRPTLRNQEQWVVSETPAPRVCSRIQSLPHRFPPPPAALRHWGRPRQHGRLNGPLSLSGQLRSSGRSARASVLADGEWRQGRREGNRRSGPGVVGEGPLAVSRATAWP